MAAVAGRISKQTSSMGTRGRLSHCFSAELATELAQALVSKESTKETIEERLKLPQEGQERFLVLFESPSSSVTQVPWAG